jgi:DNA polymerase-3 subunit beta
MKFTISRENLLEPLQLVSGVVERRQTAPVLSNLLVTAEDGRLTLVGSDQEVEMTAVIDGIVVSEPGEVTVPARKLVDICRSLPEGAELNAQQEGNRVAVDSGRFSSHLATLPVAEFPAIDTPAAEVSIELRSGDLRRLLQRVSFAMAQQDVRYFFNGVLLDVENKRVRMVATNGQRLAMSDLTLSNDLGKHQYIIPRKAVGELHRVLGTDDDAVISLKFTANHLVVDRGSVRLISKLIDATYPDYTRAIPSGGDKAVTADRNLLREALTRTAILSNELYRNVRLLLVSGRLDMHANNPQQEEAEETLAVEYDGEELEIGFNVSYLIEALTVISGERVRLTLSDASSACILEDLEEPESLFVISPMVL